MTADDVRPQAPTRWSTPFWGARRLDLADGLLYASGLVVTAFETATGRPVWTHPSQRALGPPGERFLVTRFNRWITALDRRTGEAVWQQTLRRWARTPRPMARWGLPVPLRRSRQNLSLPGDSVRELADGLLLYTSSDGVMALEAETGKRLWARHAGTHAIAVCGRNGPLVTGLLGRTVVALEPTTAKVLWHRRGLFAAVPFQDRTLLTEIRREDLVLLDPWTAEPVVLLRTPGGGRDVVPFAEGQGLIFVVVAGEVGACDALSGDLAWSDTTRTADGFGLACDQYATGEAIYVSDRAGRVRALDPLDGAVRWTSPPLAEMPETTYPVVELTVDHDVVVARARGGYLAVLDRTTGERLLTWTDPGADRTTGPPAVAVDADRVYVAGDDHLYALPIRPAAPAPTTAARPRRRLSHEPPLRRTHRLSADPPRKWRRPSKG